MTDLHSHRTQLVLTALAAAGTTAGLLTAYHAWDHARRRRDLNQEAARSIAARPSFLSKPSSSDPGRSLRTAQGLADGQNDPSDPSGTVTPVDGYAYDEELIREQLARNYAFFGDEGMAKVRGGSVVIVGCGGVGSWAAVMLARS
jgi:hypothetical protein